MRTVCRGAVNKDSLEVIEQALGIVAAIGADVEYVDLSPAFVGEIQRVIECLRVTPQPE